uniref:Voltage-dependent calcium channel alpha-1 subunit IQ domain-containing protein n=1 Tax=Panagrolaimus davidi TaxID=227884 RepID=A0A914QUH9_9BILA
MLRNIAPPVGFGKKCPYRLAYKHLIRMNMPVAADGTVHFTTTLFALIRESLSIKMRPVEEMDEADEELRQTLRKIWPLKAKKNTIDLVVPPNMELQFQKLTVGKIYAGLLILENYRAKKSGTELELSKRFRAAQHLMKNRRSLGAIRTEMTNLIGGGGGFFGLRNLVQAAKSAAGAGHLSVPANESATSPLQPNGGPLLSSGLTPTTEDGGIFPMMLQDQQYLQQQSIVRAPSPSSRPYSLFSTLVDTIKAAKSSDSIEHDAAHHGQQQQHHQHLSHGGHGYEDKTSNRRLSGMFSRMRRRESRPEHPTTQVTYLFYNLKLL